VPADSRRRAGAAGARTACEPCIAWCTHHTQRGAMRGAGRAWGGLRSGRRGAPRSARRAASPVVGLRGGPHAGESARQAGKLVRAHPQLHRRGLQRRQGAPRPQEGARREALRDRRCKRAEQGEAHVHARIADDPPPPRFAQQARAGRPHGQSAHGNERGARCARLQHSSVHEM